MAASGRDQILLHCTQRSGQAGRMRVHLTHRGSNQPVRIFIPTLFSFSRRDKQYATRSSFFSAPKKPVAEVLSAFV